MGRRRLGQLAAAVVLASGIVTVGAPRASAATELQVEVALRDGSGQLAEGSAGGGARRAGQR